MTDEQLMNQVSNGKLESLRILFERYQTPIFRFFRRSGRDQSTAEDLAQNVFERVLKYKDSYSIDKNFKPWIFSIAYNISHDDFKRNKTHQLESSIANHFIQKENTMHKIIERETLVQAKKAMSMLSKEAQEIIWLNWNGQLRYKEIGEVMGISESTARVKAYRAIKKLQEEFQKLDLA